MDENVLWVLKMIGVIFCLWYITGGPIRFQEYIQENKKTPPVENISSTYSPRVYTQTIILR